MVYTYECQCGKIIKQKKQIYQIDIERHEKTKNHIYFIETGTKYINNVKIKKTPAVKIGCDACNKKPMYQRQYQIHIESTMHILNSLRGKITEDEYIKKIEELNKRDLNEDLIYNSLIGFRKMKK